jgi:hypothetical protein
MQPNKERGFLFGRQTANKLFRMAGGSSGTYGPSEVTMPNLDEGGGGGEVHFFELLEDMPLQHGKKAWAKFLDWDKNVITEDWVYNWGKAGDGVVGNAPAGFLGTCAKIGNRWAFNQAECGQTCNTTTSLNAQTPPDATIGQTNYSYTITKVNAVTAGSFSATGLPTGWAINASTGAITGPTSGAGVVGPARDLVLFITATATKAGSGTCTLTRRLVIKIVPGS